MIIGVFNYFVRSVYIKFACKLSNLSEYQISRLSDEELFKLVEEKFSELSDEETRGVINAVIGPLIYFLFPRSNRTIPIPKDNGMSRYMTLMEQEDHVYQTMPWKEWMEDLMELIVYLAKLIGYLLAKCIHYLFVSLGFVVHWTTIPVYVINVIIGIRYFWRVWKRLDYSKRLNFTKPYYLPKGLNCATQPYIRETHILFRQDLSSEGNRAASERHI